MEGFCSDKKKLNMRIESSFLKSFKTICIFSQIMIEISYHKCIHKKNYTQKINKKSMRKGQF